MKLQERLLRMARCIYIAVEQTVADDISDGLTKAAAQLDLYEAALREAERALQPFASHVGKDGEIVKLIIGKDNWTRTLFTEDFERVREAKRKIGALLNSTDTGA